jgi:excisionase family DNA binding protein
MQGVSYFPYSEPELRSLFLSTLREHLPALLVEAERLREEGSPTASADDDTFLTRTEAAQLLRVGLVTLRNLETRGELKPLRISRRVLFRKSELLDALHRSGQAPPSASSGRGRR